MEEDNN